MKKMHRRHLKNRILVQDSVSSIVQTTLYELIAALNEDVLPEEDWVVTDAVLELFETGRAKLLAATDNGVI